MLSLRDIQAQYFDLLDFVFGKNFDHMKRIGSNPTDYAVEFAFEPGRAEGCAGVFREFLRDIKDFWIQSGPAVLEQLRAMKTLKSVFGGDASPRHSPNIARSVGLYMDTIVLPDPLLRFTLGVDKFQEVPLLCYVLRHVLNVLHYRKLALAEVDPPIVVIAPDFQFIEGDLLDQVNQLVASDLLVHCTKLFGRGFSDVEQLKSFLEINPSTLGLASAIIDPSRAVLTMNWQVTP